MKIILNDRTELVVSNERGQKLKQALLSNQDGFVDINGSLIKKSAISRIEPGGYTEADIIEKNDPAMRIRSDNRTDEQIYTAARSKAESVREILKRKGLKGLE